MSEPNKKRIILLSKVSTYRARPFLEAAQRLGIEVVQGIDMHPDLADHWQVPLHIQLNKPQETVENIVVFARRHPVQAVISLDDSASLVAAMASEALGLPHNNSQAALAARNKYEMRKMLASSGVACPTFLLYQATADPTTIAAEIEYPVVLKPLLLSGSRGVMRVNNPAEFEAAFERLKRMLAGYEAESGGNQILVETYIPRRRGGVGRHLGARPVEGAGPVRQAGSVGRPLF